MTTTIYVCQNNGVTAVIGEAGKAKLELVRDRAAELYRAARAATSDGYVDAGPLYGQAYEEIGRIPTATFVRPEYYEHYAPYATGTTEEFEKLSAGCRIVNEDFGVPFSNGGVSSTPRAELMRFTVSLSEMLEIFGLEVAPRTAALV